MTIMLDAITRESVMYRPLERIGGGQVKGSLLRAHVDWVRESASREETIEFFESLPAAVRGSAANALTSGWYPFAALTEVDRAILSVFGTGGMSILEEPGRHFARRTLAHVVRDGGTHLFLQRIALVHERVQDVCTVAYSSSSSNAGVMTHSNALSVSPLFCASVAGYYEEALRLHGESGVSVSERSCQCVGDRVCRFELSWKQAPA